MPFSPAAKNTFWGPVVEPPVDNLRPVTPVERKPKSWGSRHVIGAAVLYLVLQVPFLMLIAALVAVTEPPRAQGVTVEQQLVDLAMTPAVLIPGFLLQWSVFFGFPWFLSRWRGQKSMRLDFGFFAAWRDIPLGFLAGIALQGVMIGFGSLFAVEDGGNTNQLASSTGFTLILMVIATAFVAPVVEEVFFRGLILRSFLRTFARVDLAPVHDGVTDHFRDNPPGAMRRRLGTVVAVLLSSTIFGAMHLQSGDNGIGLGQWLVVGQTGVLGLVFAIIAIKMKRLGFVIATHFGFNVTAVVLTLLLV